jgi:hypothetical protein
MSHEGVGLGWYVAELPDGWFVITDSRGCPWCGGQLAGRVEQYSTQKNTMCLPGRSGGIQKQERNDPGVAYDDALHGDLRAAITAELARLVALAY